MTETKQYEIFDFVKCLLDYEDMTLDNGKLKLTNVFLKKPIGQFSGNGEHFDYVLISPVAREIKFYRVKDGFDFQVGCYRLDVSVKTIDEQVHFSTDVLLHTRDESRKVCEITIKSNGEILTLHKPNDQHGSFYVELYFPTQGKPKLALSWGAVNNYRSQVINLY